MGRWSADPAARGAACPDVVSRSSPEPAPPVVSQPQSPAPVPSPVAAPPPRTASPARRPAAPAPVTSQVMARVASEARAKLDGLRSHVTSKCSPPGGSGGAPVKVTYHLAFDAAGHEIARAVDEERTGQAGTFGKCLRGLPGMALSVTPPGATVAVSVPTSYP
jgi:hypothetical protein